MDLLNELAHVAKEEAQRYYYDKFFEDNRINSLEYFIKCHHYDSEDFEVSYALNRLKSNIGTYGDFKEVNDMLEWYDKGLTAFYNEKQAELAQISQN